VKEQQPDGRPPPAQAFNAFYRLKPMVRSSDAHIMVFVMTTALLPYFLPAIIIEPEGRARQAD
jgi:hypothetical protein